jgi:hypothetical protein
MYGVTVFAHILSSYITLSLSSPVSSLASEISLLWVKGLLRKKLL